MANAHLSYRFLIDSPSGALTLNATGLHDREMTDRHDFRLTTAPAPPAWTRSAVMYEIFLDRFARGSDAPTSENPLTGWAIQTAWDAPILDGRPEATRQLYGGTLGGIEEHLAHLVDLGATALYLTPFFPANSNHRYDAASFDIVDPLLGGDTALSRLTAAANHAGMRVIGDLTLNHTGSSHHWFVKALSDTKSVEAGFYLFDDHPDDYATFGGVREMPKLDHRNPELRRRLFDGPESVADRFIRHFGLDGWRIDVAQSAGHHGESNRTLTSAAETVATARAASVEAYVVAEHQFDASDELAGEGWHVTMAYAAFTRPLWSWLAEEDIDRHWGVPGSHAPYSGRTMAEVMDDFNGLIPWRSRVHSLNLLDSHDTPRLQSVIGRERYLVALGVLMTMPGIPMIFAGDEIGTFGDNLESARQPFRWDRRTWDPELFTRHKDLIQLRRNSSALINGGFRWLHTEDDVVIYQRQSLDETIIVQASRRTHRAVPCPLDLTGLLGTPDTRAGENLPTDGPSLHLWTVRRRAPLAEDG